MLSALPCAGDSESTVYRSLLAKYRPFAPERAFVNSLPVSHLRWGLALHPPQAGLTKHLVRPSIAFLTGRDVPLGAYASRFPRLSIGSSWSAQLAGDDGESRV